MSTIPTAEEFLKDYENITDHYADQEYYGWKLIEALQEFAKLHVEAALKEASKEFDSKTYSEFVLNAYPLTNIK